MGTGGGGGGRSRGGPAPETIPGDTGEELVEYNGVNLVVTKNSAGETLWGSGYSDFITGKAMLWDPQRSVLGVGESHYRAQIAMTNATNRPYLASDYDRWVKAMYMPPRGPQDTMWGGSLRIFTDRIVNASGDLVSREEGFRAGHGFLGMARRLNIPAGTRVEFVERAGGLGGGTPAFETVI